MLKLSLAAAACLPLLAHAQAAPDGWQACSSVADNRDRLACFDRWSAGQRATPAAAAVSAPAPAPAPVAAPPARAPAVARASSAARLRLTAREGCHDPEYTRLSRFWELERGSDCGVFGLRSFRPMVAEVAIGDSVNRQPTSDNPANNAPAAIAYSTREVRLQMSMRTKLAKRMLVPAAATTSDSLWFAYSQQSYWQLFSPGISRPFRSTDHEPEVMYVYPLQAALAGWRLRYGGLGVVHHSNGQSLPYSRSWNRVYAMAGVERGDFQLQGRVWRRIREHAADDDNPHISDFYGRAELQASWHPDADNQFTATWRHSLTSHARGSLRLEWFRALWGENAATGGLQLHTQFFSGYGDTLLDFNRRRNVFTIGLSLAEW